MEVDRKAMKELVRGREFANQLRQVFTNGGGGDIISDQLATTATDPKLFARHLLNNVLNSIANILFLLDKKHPTNVHKRDFSFISPPKSEDSQQSSPGRGCYKRRKTTQARETVSETTIDDDGHLWRKYGQKMVLNSKYARNYYRCTHKVDQRCEATKQFQRIQEDPPLYKTTYYSRHTCNDDGIILEQTSPPSPADHTSSILLSFSGTSTTFPTPIPTTKQLDNWPLSSSVVKYCKEDVPSASLDDSQLLSHHYQPTLDTSTAPMHPTFDTSDHMDMLYGLLCDNSVQLDDFFQPFLGFS